MSRDAGGSNNVTATEGKIKEHVTLSCLPTRSHPRRSSTLEAPRCHEGENEPRPRKRAGTDKKRGDEGGKQRRSVCVTRDRTGRGGRRWTGRDEGGVGGEGGPYCIFILLLLFCFRLPLRHALTLTDASGSRPWKRGEGAAGGRGGG